MVYAISFVIYVIVFGACLHLIKSQPDRAESFVVRICLVGFCLQLFINYLFWGNPTAFGILSEIAHIERNMINLFFLSLTSIFCYGSLMVLLLKAKDFYQ